MDNNQFAYLLASVYILPQDPIAVNMPFVIFGPYFPPRLVSVAKRVYPLLNARPGAILMIKNAGLNTPP
jgi:hypothetical protein